ncbi:MAG: prolipoprotein diacylglyceryl transferase [Gammaproteobacteria bacterium]|nr:prolipoprotein diacylglyceryl transferase [Gammaproteobacteria bacterium]MCP4089577.1 prolipoprotein diacylglyceryl transferase [Gammaproteobacteria bacterium]MCP4278088.1 prolipoprotein diacylglyceryl transferase [Gammaproteobacteria bacterium]MCP4832468.1 prolipoprotein diacylglyceryl transferase [Gammaproteobacteria bacterium]MCP4930160.1 prolipoprotein diacylglyceryl transferase [Gammaproteobacteria bacterium]
MFTYTPIDPIAIELGPLAVRWYGLMYVIGILGGWWLGRVLARRKYTPLNEQQVDDLVTWVALGVILGGRFGSVLFYNFGDFLDHPLMLFEIWKGGMSFHGGMLGVSFSIWLFGRRNGVHFWDMNDFIAPVIAVGLGAGRIGNFINGELWGKPTDVPWGFIVDGVGRHASQLYEAFFEGLCLFVIVWVYALKPRPRMAVTGLFLAVYGLSRFGVEFVRLPDAHIGYMAWGWLTRGQVLSAPMVIGGILIIILAYRKPVFVKDL